MISIRVLPVSSRGIQVRVRTVSAGRKVRVPYIRLSNPQDANGSDTSKGITFDHLQVRRLSSIPFWLLVAPPMCTAPGYPRSWCDFRRRDLLFWFVLLSYAQVVVLI